MQWSKKRRGWFIAMLELVEIKVGEIERFPLKCVKNQATVSSVCSSVMHDCDESAI